MKKILIGAVAYILIAGMFSVSMAAVITNTSNDGIEDFTNGNAYSYYQNSGSLVGSVDTGGNIKDSADISNFLVDRGYSVSGLIQVNVEFYGWNGSPNGYANYLGTTGSDGKIDVNSGSYASGTWNTVLDTALLNFYSVKAGNFSAIYLQNPADNVGSWSTYDLWLARSVENPGNSKAISVSHYVAGLGDAAPVPEPATFLLLGSGLAGLAFYRRKRK